MGEQGAAASIPNYCIPEEYWEKFLGFRSRMVNQITYVQQEKVSIEDCGMTVLYSCDSLKYPNQSFFVHGAVSVAWFVMNIEHLDEESLQRFWKAATGHVDHIIEKYYEGIPP